MCGCVRVVCVCVKCPFQPVFNTRKHSELVAGLKLSVVHGRNTTAGLQVSRVGNILCRAVNAGHARLLGRATEVETASDGVDAATYHLWVVTSDLLC